MWGSLRLAPINNTIICQYHTVNNMPPFLTVQKFRCEIVQYISNKLVNKCIQQSSHTISTSFIIDSPSLPGVIHITQGIMSTNKHSERGCGCMASLLMSTTKKYCTTF